MPRLRGVRFDLLAQPLHVSVQGSGVRELHSPPQRVEADFARDNLPEVRREQREEIELLATELDVDAIAGHRTAHEIHFEIAVDDEVFVTGGGGATQNGTNARDELAQAIGLGDVVRGANLEAEYDVHLTGARGDHYHGNTARVIDLTAEVHPGAVGEHQVEQDDVGLGADQNLACARECLGTNHDEAFGGQTDGEGILVTLLILHDED